jgi:hypothetical protein
MTDKIICLWVEIGKFRKFLFICYVRKISDNLHMEVYAKSMMRNKRQGEKTTGYIIKVEKNIKMV